MTNINVGLVDRAFRMIVGLVAILAFGVTLSGIAGVIGLAMFATAYSAFCPLYQMLEVSTA